MQFLAITDKHKLLFDKTDFSKLYSVFENYVGVRIADDNFLSAFDYIHEFGEYVSGGSNDIAIWAINDLLFGFEFLRVANVPCECGGEFYFVPSDVLLSLEIFPQNHVFVFRNHVGHGHWLQWAVSFPDGYEKRRYVGFMWNLASEGSPVKFVEFALDEGVPPLSLPPWIFDCCSS